MELSELITKLRKEESLPEKVSEPMEKGSIDPEVSPPTPRQTIERLLSQGPRPYSEILAALGGIGEDQLRAAIRGWDELAAFDDGGTWT